jgi:hypothetical protein
MRRKPEIQQREKSVFVVTTSKAKSFAWMVRKGKAVTGSTGVLVHRNYKR